MTTEFCFLSVGSMLGGMLAGKASGGGSGGLSGLMGKFGGGSGGGHHGGSGYFPQMIGHQQAHPKKSGGIGMGGLALGGEFVF